MESFVPTAPVVFIAIVLGYLALAFFFLGARKVYFEPFLDKNEESEDNTETSAAPANAAAHKD